MKQILSQFNPVYTLHILPASKGGTIWKAQTWKRPWYIFFKILICWRMEYEVTLEDASQKSCIIGRNSHWGLPNIKQPSHTCHYVQRVRKSTQLLLF